MSSTSTRPEPFWLCHECGAQMRPITRNGVAHCASCDGEFLEILDAEVNPDPFHDLPPPPPVRPRSFDGASSTAATAGDSTGSRADDRAPYATNLNPGAGSILSTLLGGLLGGSAAGEQGQRSDEYHRQNTPWGQPYPHLPGEQPSSYRQATDGGPQDPQGRQEQGQGQRQAGGQGGHPNLRTFNFNLGGGRGSVSFGTFGGGMGPFGPAGPSDDAGLDAFFPGFGTTPAGAGAGAGAGGQRTGMARGDPLGPEELIRALMGAIGGEAHFMGPNGRMNMGDYVMTDNGFDNVLEHLMQAAGPQGPLPASDTVIEGLPRVTLTEELLEKSQYKECPVCQDDFVIGVEVIRVPCSHLFHTDCLVPWLKTNGSCPVCRFSLVPQEGQQAQEYADGGHQQPNAQGGGGGIAGGIGSTVTNILQRLWGQNGTSNPPSNVNSPTPSTAPLPISRPSSQQPSSRQTSSQLQPQGQQETGESSTTTTQPSLGSPIAPHSGAPQTEEGAALSTAIPEDYRERHRRREQEQERERERAPDPPYDDLD